MLHSLSILTRGDPPSGLSCPLKRRDWLEISLSKSLEQMVALENGCFLWKLILIKNAIAVDSSFPRFGIHFASKCVCCSSPCIERVDHLSQSDIARIDNRVSFLSQSQCGFLL